MRRDDGLMVCQVANECGGPYSTLWAWLSSWLFHLRGCMVSMAPAGHSLP